MLSIEDETVTVEGNVDFAEGWAFQEEVTDLTVNGNVVSDSNLDVVASANDKGSVTIKTGDVTVPGDGGVEIFTHGEETKVDVTVGDVTSGGTALLIRNYGGEIDLETGAVSAKTEGVDLQSSVDYQYSEATAEEFAGAVSGDPTEVETPDSHGDYDGYPANATKIETYELENGNKYFHFFYNDGSEEYYKSIRSNPSSNTEVTINGDMTVVGTEDYYWITGIDENVRYTDQAADILVEGDLSVDNQGDGGSVTGIRVSTENDKETGTASAAIGGGLTVTAANGSVFGVSVDAGYGEARVDVGNVTLDGESGWGAGVYAVDGSASLNAGNIQITLDESWDSGVSVVSQGSGSASLGAGDITYAVADESASSQAVWIYVGDDQDETFTDGAAVLVADDITSTVNGIEIMNADGSVAVNVSDLNTAGTAVSINSREDTTTEFTAKTIHSEDDTGVRVYSHGGENTIKAGAITAEDFGLDINVNDKYHSRPLTAEKFAAVATGDPDDSWTYNTPSDMDPDSVYETGCEVFFGENGVRYYCYSYSDGSKTYSESWSEPSTGFTVAEVGGITVKGTESNN